MVSVYSKNLNIYNAEQFKESVTETANSSLYFTIGRVQAWANDSAPLQANTSVTSLYEVYRNMIAGKKITGNDIYHCIPRNDWSSGIVYDQYDHCTCSLILFDANVKFFVVTPNWDVYKCISNNSGAPSQNVPTQKDTTETIQEADGYIWKYMYTVSPAEQLRFTTDQYIPVKTLANDDGSLQWQVQDNAVDGSINYIDIVDGGANYNDNTKIYVTITGDGTGANAYATTNVMSNTINSVIVVAPGSGYTYASVQIVDTSTVPGSGASLKAMISPPGGHGSDPIRELGGSNLMLNIRLRYDESNTMPVTNDYRQVAIIKDPYRYGTTTVKTNTVFSQFTTLTLTGVGDDEFTEDEIVYQGSSLSNSTFTGVIVAWNGTDQLKVTNVTGTPTSQGLVGATSGATGTVVTPVTNPDLEEYSGDLLYIDNIKPIQRSSDQIEDFKIVLKF